MTPCSRCNFASAYWVRWQYLGADVRLTLPMASLEMAEQFARGWSETGRGSPHVVYVVEAGVELDLGTWLDGVKVS